MNKQYIVSILLVVLLLGYIPITVQATGEEDTSEESTTVEDTGVNEGHQDQEDESIESNDNNKQKSQDSDEESKKEETTQDEGERRQEESVEIGESETKDIKSSSSTDEEVNEETDPKDSDVEVEESNEKSEGLLELGAQDDRVIELEQDLNKLGFGALDETDSFDEQTEDSVKAFQDYYGYEVTGIADQETLDRIAEALEHPLQEGNHVEEAIPVKQKLNRIGYDGIAVSTNFGPYTASQVEAFQADHGLPVSGIVEDTTKLKLDNVFSSKQQSEDSLELGDQDDRVIELEQNLNKLGFGALDETDSFDEQTEDSVKAFQEYYDYEVTGIADQETLDRIAEALEHPLQEGNHVEEAIPIKQKLNRIGYDGIAVSTNFGPYTASQVEAFQADHGLPVSGIVEDNTKAKLDSEFTSLYSEGTRHENITQMKRDLNRLGFDGLAIADLYGSFTAQRVKDFQSYYGLDATGQANLKTLNKIDEVLNHPLQEGNHVEEVIPVKQKLNRIGYDGIAVSTNFGPYTASQVEAFQADHGLPVSGIVEDNTKAKLDSEFTSLYSEGTRHENITQMKRDLNRLGFDGLAIADLYGSFTTQRVKDFQSYYGLDATGQANLKTLNKIDEVLNHPLQEGNHMEEAIPVKQKLNRIGYDGIAVSTNFGPYTASQVEAFQADHGLPVSGIVEDNTKAKLDNVFTSIYSEGSRHENITQMKRDLNKLGFGGLANADLYGPHTTKRVKEFQAYYGLEVTGQADLETLNKIDEVLHGDLVNIFIDPGHGDHDPGGQGYGLQEKNIVLDIALKAADILSNEYIGVSVMLSRTTDEFIELKERAKMANEWGADYFVSVHSNSFNGNANGFESFIHNKNASETDENKQRQIHEYLINKMQVRDRGMKEANFSVLRNSTMPSILLEYLFIDNKNDNDKLKKSSYRNFLGEITAEALAYSFDLKKK